LYNLVSNTFPQKIFNFFSWQIYIVSGITRLTIGVGEENGARENTD
jgi:hypothetical protein